MKITTITYKGIFRTSPTDPYLNEHIQIEVALNEGDSVQDALDLARKEAMENHLRNNKGVQISADLSAFPNDEERAKFVTANPSIPVINREHERLEMLIDNAKTVEELERIGSSHYDWSPKLGEQYQQKLKQLNNE